MLNIFLQVICW